VRDRFRGAVNTVIARNRTEKRAQERRQIRGVLDSELKGLKGQADKFVDDLRKQAEKDLSSLRGQFSNVDETSKNLFKYSQQLEGEVNDLKSAEKAGRNRLKFLSDEYGQFKSTAEAELGGIKSQLAAAEKKRKNTGLLSIASSLIAAKRLGKADEAFRKLRSEGGTQLASLREELQGTINERENAVEQVNRIRTKGLELISDKEAEIKRLREEKAHSDQYYLGKVGELDAAYVNLKAHTAKVDKLKRKKIELKKQKSEFETEVERLKQGINATQIKREQELGQLDLLRGKFKEFKEEYEPYKGKAEFYEEKYGKKDEQLKNIKDNMEYEQFFEAKNVAPDQPLHNEPVSTAQRIIDQKAERILEGKGGIKKEKGTERRIENSRRIRRVKSNEDIAELRGLKTGTKEDADIASALENPFDEAFSNLNKYLGLLSPQSRAASYNAGYEDVIGVLGSHLRGGRHALENISALGQLPINYEEDFSRASRLFGGIEAELEHNITYHKELGRTPIIFTGDTPGNFRDSENSRIFTRAFGDFETAGTLGEIKNLSQVIADEVAAEF
jgi:chromosome segregation ATPase